MRIAPALFPWISLLCWMVLASAAAADEKPLDAEHAKQMAAGLELFKTRVRPLLQEHCVRCHGGAETESGLDLTSRAALLKGGTEGPAMVAGKGSQSRLVKLVARREEPFMPADGEPLGADAVAALSRWIDLGAPYDRPLKTTPGDPSAWTRRKLLPEDRQFWSFQRLRAVRPPNLPDNAWAQTPIDHFVLARLQQAQMAPAERASKEKLIRRFTLQLLGLAPSPDEIERFVADTRPDAVSRLVDRLLASPRYGERWARFWLDAARFAESHGFEHDYDRPHAYHYRDFVIWALNQDLPYDTFTRWQLAGDEFAPDNRWAMMATGFLGAGVFPTQITKNEVERTRYDALDDMASTTSSAFLGLSVGCARCHDHKFDPIPQADYYRFTATFTTTVRSEIDLPLDPAADREALQQYQAEHAPLVQRRDQYEQDQLPTQLAAWLANHDAETLARDSGWILARPEQFRSVGGATLTPQDDGSLLASGTNPDFDAYEVTIHSALPVITGLRIEALADPSLVKGGPGRAGNGNFALTNLTVRARPLNEPEVEDDKNLQAVTLAKPLVTFEQKGLLAEYTIDANPKSAWAVDPQFGKDHAVAYPLATPLRSPQGFALHLTLEFKNNQRHSIGRLRISTTGAASPLSLQGGIDPTVLQALQSPAKDRTAAQTQALLAWYKHQDPQWLALQKAVEQHAAQAPKPQVAKVMVCSEGVKPMRHHTQGADFFPETFFLKRGDTEQKLGAAKPGFLQVLTPGIDGPSPVDTARWSEPAPKGWRTSYRRRALANWMCDTEQGAGNLLARVIVNRLWQHHFGRGLVSTPNDFGAQGELPSHPELLEWLAAELIRHDWNLKPIQRLILTSAVAQQGGTFRADYAARDPQNRLLWRRTPRRLEAEAIRDTMLHAAGGLELSLYGPGTLDESQNRRSIYFKIKRSKLIPFLQLFDAPEPLVSVGNRPTTTIAPQALLFLNSPHVRRYAQQLATRIAQGAPVDKDLDAVIRRGYLLTLGRSPTDEELADNRFFLQQQQQSHRQAGKNDVQAWETAAADFCQVLFGLNEFIYVD